MFRNGGDERGREFKYEERQFHLRRGRRYASENSIFFFFFFTRTCDRASRRHGDAAFYGVTFFSLTFRSRRYLMDFPVCRFLRTTMDHRATEGPLSKVSDTPRTNLRCRRNGIYREDESPRGIPEQFRSAAIIICYFDFHCGIYRFN